MKTIALARNIFLSNFNRLKNPYKLTFILTYKCNCSCLMCNIWKENDFKNEMSLDEIDNFFFINNYFSWVNLSGGEIFLRKDIYEIIKIILLRCKNIYLVNFPTTGIITDTIISTTEKMLSESSCNLLVTISLDGPKILHERIRNRQNCWDKAIETFKQLRKLKRRNFNVFLGMTLFGLNYTSFEQTIEEVRAYIPDISVNDFHFNLAHQSRSYYKNTDFNIDSLELIGKRMQKLSKMRNFPFQPVALLERCYQNKINNYIENKRIPLNCKALQSSCFINPYWDVFACSVDNLKIGNLRKDGFSLRNIWNSLTAESVRKLISEKKCVNCWTPCEAYQTILGNLLHPRTFFR